MTSAPNRRPRRAVANRTRKVPFRESAALVARIGSNLRSQFGILANADANRRECRANWRQYNYLCNINDLLAEGEELGSNLLHVAQRTPANSGGRDFRAPSPLGRGPAQSVLGKALGRNAGQTAQPAKQFGRSSNWGRHDGECRSGRSIAALMFFLASSAVFSDDMTEHADIIDGDTLEIHGTRARLWGIAPESNQLHWLATVQ